MIITISIVVGVIVLLYCIGWIDWSFGKKPTWGVTFSELYANYLGLDWKQAYLAVLDDLEVSNLRLVAYWSTAEDPDDVFNFKDLDWQVDEAAKRDKKVILTIGYKAPRWPECHQPGWSNTLSEEKLQEEILEYLTATINHYKNSPNIIAWQIENEPLIEFFGKCPKPDKDFLKRELLLVKTLDNSRPVVLTDSGELSLWLKTAGLSDVLGTTLYRIVWQRYLGSTKHWEYNPLFYRARAEIVKKLFSTKKVIIAELQVEPWGSKNRSLTQMTVSEQLEHFSVNDLKNNMKFAKKTGLNEIYLWGVEWAYWLKTKHNDSRYWDAMKEGIK